MVYIKRFVTGVWKENTYIVSSDSSNAVIIDGGESADLIINYVNNNRLNVCGLINTHGHFDHIGAVAKLQSYFNTSFAIHNGDQKLVRQVNLYRKLYKEDGFVNIPKINIPINSNTGSLVYDDLNFEIIETPGHTLGSVCFIIEGFIFTGDTVFKNNIGRTDLPGGNRVLLNNSLKSLFSDDREMVILGGHGEETTKKNELASNDRLNEALTWEQGSVS